MAVRKFRIWFHFFSNEIFMVQNIFVIYTGVIIQVLTNEAAIYASKQPSDMLSGLVAKIFGVLWEERIKNLN